MRLTRLFGVGAALAGLIIVVEPSLAWSIPCRIPSRPKGRDSLLVERWDVSATETMIAFVAAFALLAGTTLIVAVLQ